MQFDAESRKLDRTEWEVILRTAVVMAIVTGAAWRYFGAAITLGTLLFWGEVSILIALCLALFHARKHQKMSPMPLAFLIGDSLAMWVKFSPVVFIAPIGIPLDFIIGVYRTAKVVKALDEFKKQGFGKDS